MEQTKQYEYVDLGLPSGLKWAKCNVGATSESDYGDYFMWGSTTPNTTDDCNRENYKYCNKSSDTLTKYGITTLDPEDDAATQIMGGDWRMPTQAEWYELWNNTNSGWISNYNGTGVNGRKFTSKKNGNSIFIPAAGQRSDSSFIHQGNQGNVWCSSSNASVPNFAWGLYFDSDICCMGYTLYYCGWSVRGVIE